jgi:hypothetical protein
MVDTKVSKLRMLLSTRITGIRFIERMKWWETLALEWVCGRYWTGGCWRCWTCCMECWYCGLLWSRKKVQSWGEGPSWPWVCLINVQHQQRLSERLSRIRQDSFDQEQDRNMLPLVGHNDRRTSTIRHRNDCVQQASKEQLQDVPREGLWSEQDRFKFLKVEANVEGWRSEQSNVWIQLGAAGMKNHWLLPMVYLQLCFQ